MREQYGTWCQQERRGPRAATVLTKSSLKPLAILWIICAAFVLTLSKPVSATELRDETLSLTVAVKMALEDDPGLKSLAARGRAFGELAIAEGQLPDPKVKLGVANLPVESFDFSQEPMTQAQIGLSQSFPRGRTRSIKSEKMLQLSGAELFRAMDLEARIRLEVRKAWLDRYYFEETEVTLKESKQVFQELVSFVEALYSTGRNTQQDVLRAELELQILEDRLIEISSQIETSKASLAKWLGPAANRALPKNLPLLGEPADEGRILEQLGRHPSIRMLEQQIDVRRSDADLARQEFKPGWKLDVGYGYRDGQDPLGRDRSDFATAMLTFDVPLFFKKKQSRTLEARKEQVNAAQFRRDDQVRELRRMLETEYASWQRLGEREAHYSRVVMLRAEENLEASLQSYQANVTDFTGLMRAQLMQLDTRLKEMRIRIDKLKTQAALLYLQGEPK